MDTLHAARPTILAVDDSADVLAMISGILKDLYKVKIANSGERALEIVFSTPPDLILLDVVMPDMDGYEVCRRLKTDPATQEIPVIFLTAKTESDDEIKGFELGAVDYIAKPISPSKLLARVKTHTALRQARLDLQEWNNNLKRKVINNAGIIREQAHELSGISSLQSGFSSFQEMVDARHFAHANDVRKLAAEAAKRMGLESRVVREIGLAAQLHDIGKLGVSGEQIAHEAHQGMSETELTEYRQHPLRSQSILNHLEPLHQVSLMIRHHHEAFNGSGFPDGLKGDAIPLGAQLITIADFLDHAVKSSGEGEMGSALKKLSQNAGTLFNPELVQYFSS